MALTSRGGAPRVLGASTLVRLFLIGMRVLALPDVSCQVAEDAREVMMAAATGRRCFAKLAAAYDATESLALGQRRERGAAPKRGAMIWRQTT